MNDEQNYWQQPLHRQQNQHTKLNTSENSTRSNVCGDVKWNNFDFNSGGVGIGLCDDNDEPPLRKAILLSSARNKSAEKNEFQGNFHSVLESARKDNENIHAEKFENETRRISKLTKSKQQCQQQNEEEQEELFLGYENNMCSIVGTRPMHWVAKKQSSFTSARKSSVSSCLSKATMTRIQIPSKPKIKNASGTKAHVANLLASATLPPKSKISTSTAKSEGIIPKKLFNTAGSSTIESKPSTEDEEEDKNLKTSSLQEHDHRQHGVVFLPSFLTQTNDNSIEENNEPSSSISETIEQEESHKNNMKHSQQQECHFATPNRKKRKHTESFLLQELYVLRDQIEQDLVKLQQNVSLHYNFIDADIVSTNTNHSAAFPAYPNNHKDILGYINQIKTFAWIHCSCTSHGGACMLDHVGKKIRIYNSIVIPNQEDSSDCYSMILCTQIWKVSPNATTYSNIPTCSFLSEE